MSTTEHNRLLKSRLARNPIVRDPVATPSPPLTKKPRLLNRIKNKYRHDSLDPTKSTAADGATTRPTTAGQPTISPTAETQEADSLDPHMIDLHHYIVDRVGSPQVIKRSAQYQELIEMILQLHYALGHMDFKKLIGQLRLYKGVSKPLVQALSRIKTVKILADLKRRGCLICQKSKTKSLPHKARSVETTDPLANTASLDLIKITPTSGQGNNYALSFIELRHRYKHIRFQKGRDGEFTVKNLQSIATYLEEDLRGLHGDYEYMKGSVAKYCAENNIRMISSTPNIKEQHGLIEKMHQDVLRVTIALLAQANLDYTYWQYAMEQAVFILNITPCRALDGMTPYESKYGKAPDIRHLQTFGSKVVFLNHQDTSKVALKGRVGTVLNQVLNMPHGTYNILVDPDQFTTARTPTIVQSRDLTALVGVEPATVDIIHTDADIQDTPIESDNESESDASPLANHLQTVHRCYSTLQVEECFPTIEDKDFVFDEVDTPYFIPLVHSADSYYQHVMKVPKSAAQVKHHPKREGYEQAMTKEISKHIKFEAFEEITYEEFAKKSEAERKEIYEAVIHTSWVFTDKFGDLRARLVLCGNEQPVDGNEYSSPVIDALTVKLILAIANQRQKDVCLFDIESAYLNSPNLSTAYIRPPEGYPNADKIKFLKVKKAVNGLRSSGLSFYVDFAAHMESIGFTQSDADPCLYLKDGIRVMMHVDDGCIVADSTEIRDKFLDDIRSKYTITVDYECKRFLGMDIVRDLINGTITLSQARYVDLVLETAGMQDCNSAKSSTPMQSKYYLSKLETTPPACQDYPYRVLIGMLMWLACTTRYDIAYAVTYLSQFCAAYDDTHIAAVKRLLRYLKRTRDVTLTYHRDPTKAGLSGDAFVEAWSDADFASDPVTRRSVTGSMLTFNKSVIYGRSSRQKSIQLSTQASELVALSETARRVVFIRYLLKDLYPTSDLKPTSLHGDNQASLVAATSNTVSTKVKHLDIRDRFIQEKISDGTITTIYCPTTLMLADLFTKALDHVDHWRLVTIIQGLSPDNLQSMNITV